MKTFFENHSKIDRVVFYLYSIFFISIFLLAFTSCATLKKDSESETTTTSLTEKKKDSVKITETSGAIKDQIIVNVPASDNAEVMRLFNEMMGKMNTSKSSGSNSYSSRYDEANKQWVIDFLVAQTKNEATTVKEDSKTEETFEQKIDKYVKQIVIPWWIYAIVIFIFAKQIIWFISMFYPPLRIFVTPK